MFNKIFGFAGLLLILISILNINSLIKGDKAALTLDRENRAYGSIGDGPIPCEWEVKTPERIISENKSQAILINISNQFDEKCETVLSLRAPVFDISPIKEEQTIALDASKSGSLSWILTPRKSGTYEFAVSDLINTKVFGITVTNTFGLNVVQAKILSILGTLFGPMFTIPWWWDRLRQRKKDNTVK